MDERENVWLWYTDVLLKKKHNQLAVFFLHSFVPCIYCGRQMDNHAGGTCQLSETYMYSQAPSTF